jgi:hypothetical protein
MKKVSGRLRRRKLPKPVDREQGAPSSIKQAQTVAGGIGIYLCNTRNVSLNAMQLNDFDNFAIRGFWGRRIYAE